MKLGLQKVPISALIRSNWLDTEMRAIINHVKATQYAEEKKQGATFPKPVVFFDPKSELYWVGDGFHRIVAEKINLATEVEVELKKGTKTDAVIFGIEANREQRGLPFTTGDKERCILTLLKDKVTRNWSQCRIAALVGCADSWVHTIVHRYADEIKRPGQVLNINGKMVKVKHGKDMDFSSASKKRERESKRELAINLKQSGMSNNEVAAALDIDPNTVSKYTRGVLGKVKCSHCEGTGWVKA